MRIHGLKFLQRVSFFNYAYTALAENELVGRRLEKFPVRLLDVLIAALAN